MWGKSKTKFFPENYFKKIDPHSITEKKNKNKNKNDFHLGYTEKPPISTNFIKDPTCTLADDIDIIILFSFNSLFRSGTSPKTAKSEFVIQKYC